MISASRAADAFCGRFLSILSPHIHLRTRLEYGLYISTLNTDEGVFFMGQDWEGRSFAFCGQNFRLFQCVTNELDFQILTLTVPL